MNLRISLAAARVNAGLTQSELARVLNVNKATVSNWEKGKTSPNIQAIRKLSEVSGVPSDYIFLPDKFALRTPIDCPDTT